MLGLIHAQADSLLHLGVYLTLIEVAHVIHDGVCLVLLLLEFFTPSTFAVTLVPFFLCDSVLIGSIVFEGAGRFFYPRRIIFWNEISEIVIYFLFFITLANSSVLEMAQSR